MLLKHMMAVPQTAFVWMMSFLRNNNDNRSVEHHLVFLSWLDGWASRANIHGPPRNQCQPDNPLPLTEPCQKVDGLKKITIKWSIPLATVQIAMKSKMNIHYPPEDGLVCSFGGVQTKFISVSTAGNVLVQDTKAQIAHRCIILLCWGVSI